MEVVRRTITALFLVAVAIVSGCTNPSTNLHIVGEVSNDLVKVLEANNIEFERYDDLWQAINDASENTGVMVLADHYPNVRTYMDAEMFVAAEAKNLRVYIEFPALI